MFDATAVSTPRATPERIIWNKGNKNFMKSEILRSKIVGLKLGVAGLKQFWWPYEKISFRKLVGGVGSCIFVDEKRI